MDSELTEAQKTVLCDAGAAALKKHSDGAVAAPFTWRGKPYFASKLGSALRIETIEGKLVVGRYD